MQQLASHYKAMRALYPTDNLLISFDIDGTIIDARHTVVYLLKQYDRQHGTRYFEDISCARITHHENQIQPILEHNGVPLQEQGDLLSWYFERCWSAETISASHRAFRGVLDVISWFQRQPHTAVGLNTGRPDEMRLVTLNSLNTLGQDYGIQFTSDMLHMNSQDNWAFNVGTSKAIGIERFRQKGFRVVAAIDNEPESLKGLATADPSGEMLLLHADTLYMSKRQDLPERAVPGSQYNVVTLVRTLITA